MARVENCKQLQQKGFGAVASRVAVFHRSTPRRIWAFSLTRTGGNNAGSRAFCGWNHGSVVVGEIATLRFEYECYGSTANGE